MASAVNPESPSADSCAAAASPPAGGDSVSSDTEARWQHVVAVVGAATGGAVWVSVVGSAVVGIRLQNAGLPVEPVVALMSAEHRFAIGAGYLVAPLVVGLVGYIADTVVIALWPPGPPPQRLPAAGGERPERKAWNPKRWWHWLRDRFAHRWDLLGHEPASERSWNPRRWWDRHHTPLSPDERWIWAGRTRSAVVVTVVGAVLAGLILQPEVWPLFVFQSTALLVIVLGAIRVYAHRPLDHHRWDERVIVFVLVIVGTGASALCYERLFGDAVFDVAHIQFKDGPTVGLEGGYVTTTETSVVLITRVTRARHDCPAVTAVRRDQIERIWIGPTELEVRGTACGADVDWPDLPADHG